MTTDQITKEFEGKTIETINTLGYSPDHPRVMWIHVEDDITLEIVQGLNHLGIAKRFGRPSSAHDFAMDGPADPMSLIGRGKDTPDPERVPINVHPDVRRDLYFLLYEPEMVWVGYSEFLRRAIARAYQEIQEHRGES